MKRASQTWVVMPYLFVMMPKENFDLHVTLHRTDLVR